MCMCVCTCVCMHVQVHMCLCDFTVHVCVKARGQTWSCGSETIHLILETESLVGLALTKEGRLSLVREPL